MKSESIKKLVIAAMFTAMTTVATMVIRVPSFATNGYVNIGDALVLMCAWVLGGPVGALAAGLGSGLADLLAGYVSYVPGTFVIKFAMALAAYFIYKLFIKKPSLKIPGYIVSAIVAELIMIGGYFVYESLILGYGLGAVPSIWSNAIQGITCTCLGLILVLSLNGTKAVRAHMQSSKQ